MPIDVLQVTQFLQIREQTQVYTHMNFKVFKKSALYEVSCLLVRRPRFCYFFRFPKLRKLKQMHNEIIGPTFEKINITFNQAVWSGRISIAQEFAHRKTKKHIHESRSAKKLTKKDDIYFRSFRSLIHLIKTCRKGFYECSNCKNFPLQCAPNLHIQA